jgi:hypothetical protein
MKTIRRQSFNAAALSIEGPSLSPTDQLSNFEKWDKANLGGVPKTAGMLEREYSRQALREGLRLEEK